MRDKDVFYRDRNGSIKEVRFLDLVISKVFICNLPEKKFLELKDFYNKSYSYVANCSDQEFNELINPLLNKGLWLDCFDWITLDINQAIKFIKDDLQRTPLAKRNERNYLKTVLNNFESLQIMSDF